jgi:hypothetical protein
MSFGGTTWPISSQDFILSQNNTSGFCLAAVFILTEGTTTGDAGADNLNPDWVVGDTFLVRNLSLLQLFVLHNLSFLEKCVLGVP